MSSTTIADVDKARLIKIGRWAVNRWNKHFSSIQDAIFASIEPSEHDHLNARVDAIQLRTIGLILAPRTHGFQHHEVNAAAEFLRVGQHISNLEPFKTTRETHFITCGVGHLTAGWQKMNELGREQHHEDYRSGPGIGIPDYVSRNPEVPLSEAQVIVHRDWKHWVAEEFFGIPLTAEETKSKQNCTFCGARSFSDRRLMLCGGCKITIYCDKKCQVMHRKEHKADCKAMTEETRALKGEAA
ncbi:unnamed protein product [Zymoseptoria tritici ST99CH_3D1]|nr:unnamed protein product [Zymoseptoria tritici ST99CH_3D1]